MANYESESVLKRNGGTYFGTIVSEKPTKDVLENINTPRFISNGIKYSRHSGDANKFSNLIKEGNLVKLSIGSGKDKYNSSIYIVDEIIEFTYCRHRTEYMNYEYYSKEIEDGPDKRWVTKQHIFLRPFNNRGHNIQVVTAGKDDLKSKIVNEKLINKFIYKKCYTSDKEMDEFISDFKKASLEYKSQNLANKRASERRLYRIVVPQDTLLADNLNVDSTKIVSQII